MKTTCKAPFLAWEGKSDKHVYIAQGCCNRWDCPRCGTIRAKQEYGRIVEAITTLANTHKMYFITITCRGLELPLDEAIASYMKWTNTLLTALRKDAKKRGLTWHYVQVTELQKRGHPHSHILTTYFPPDLVPGTKQNWNTVTQAYEDVPVLRSEYLKSRVISAGLGEQYDISEVQTAAGASRYVAKYLFKAIDTPLPKHWKRVRYSQSFPKLPDREGGAWVLLKPDDWYQLSSYLVLHPRDEESDKKARIYLSGADVFIQAKTPEN